MKKTVLTAVALMALLCAGSVHAAPPTATTAPAAAAAPTAKTPLSPQNNRMKDCATQYHAKKIAKSQYRAFMSQCLKNPATAAAPVAAPVSTVTKSAK